MEIGVGYVLASGVTLGWATTREEDVTPGGSGLLSCGGAVKGWVYSTGTSAVAPGSGAVTDWVDSTGALTVASGGGAVTDWVDFTGTWTVASGGGAVTDWVDTTGAWTVAVGTAKGGVGSRGEICCGCPGGRKKT